jgi:hypothetical protein
MVILGWELTVHLGQYVYHVNLKMAITTLQSGSRLRPVSACNEHLGCGMENTGQGETKGDVSCKKDVMHGQL